MIVTFDTENPADLAALVAIARGATQKADDTRDDMAYIMSLPRKERKQRLAALNAAKVSI